MLHFDVKLEGNKQIKNVCICLQGNFGSRLGSMRSNKTIASGLMQKFGPREIEKERV